MGADPNLVRATTDQPEPQEPRGDYELAPDDWRAWTVFLACRRAWRIVSGLGGMYHDGIDPSAIRATVDLLGIKSKHWPDVLWRLHILESEARKFLNKPPEVQ